MEVVQEEEGKEGGSPFVGEHGHCFKEEPSGDATTNMQLLLPRASIEPEEQQQWWEEEEGKENPNEDLQHPARPMSLDARCLQCALLLSSLSPCDQPFFGEGDACGSWRSGLR